MLYIVGLGLGNEKDITLRGLEAVQKPDKIFIEAYTSLLSFGLSSDGLSTLVNPHFLVLGYFFVWKVGLGFEERKKSLQEKLYGKPVILADRETVEEKADEILSAAADSDVAFLVVGDPFGYVVI